MQTLHAKLQSILREHKWTENAMKSIKNHFKHNPNKFHFKKENNKSMPNNAYPSGTHDKSIGFKGDWLLVKRTEHFFTAAFFFLGDPLPSRHDIDSVVAATASSLIHWSPLESAADPRTPLSTTHLAVAGRRWKLGFKGEGIGSVKLGLTREWIGSGSTNIYKQNGAEAFWYFHHSFFLWFSWK